jgi:hypothetical protein
MANPDKPAFWEKLKPVPKGKPGPMEHGDDGWIVELFRKAEEA